MLIDFRENELANISGLAISFFIFLCVPAMSGIFGPVDSGSRAGIVNKNKPQRMHRLKLR
jgi:hypothetical protein